MSQDALLEWRLEEEPPQPPPEPSARHRFPSWLRWLFLWALIVGLAVSGILYARYQQAQRVLQRDIQAELDRERQALRTGDVPILRSLLDPGADEQWQGIQENEWYTLIGNDLPLRARTIHLLSPELALVAVDGWPLPHNVRLYRRVSGRWALSFPRDADWGGELPPLRLPCAVVYARARDEAVLHALRAQAGPLCAALERLMPPNGASGLQVDLHLVPLYRAPRVDFTRNRVGLPSPWFLTLDESAQPDSIIDLISRMADARWGIEAALRPQGTTAPTEALPSPAHALRVVSMIYYMPGRALVQLVEEAGDERTPGEIWWMFENVNGRWQRDVGTPLQWGPWLQRSNDCVTLTYRAIDREWVDDIWSLVTRMCRRGRDAFHVPIQPGTLHIVLTPQMGEANVVQGDVIVSSPITWQFPVRRSLSLRLARSIAARSVPYFLHLNARGAVPRLLQGLAMAYLLPEVAWLEEDEEQLQRLAARGGLAPYTQPRMWTNLSNDLLARSLGRYVLEQWGDEELRTWLSLLPPGVVAPDVVDEATRLSMENPFPSLLQAWYMDTDPTLQAREMWLPRLRAALSDIVRFFGPASRVYVYAGGRPTLHGAHRPGTPWRGLESVILDVPINVRATTIAPAEVIARPDALHVQFFLPQNSEAEVEALVMQAREGGGMEALRLQYRFHLKNGRWVAERMR